MTRPCPCMTTSIIIKIARVISMWTPHWITVSCHGVEGPMTYGYYLEIFPFCGGGKKQKKKTKKNKKKRRQKNKCILWLGYHRYPSKYTSFPAVETGNMLSEEVASSLDVKMNNFVRDISLICFLPTKSWHDVVFIFLRLRRQHSNWRRSKQRRVTWV